MKEFFFFLLQDEIGKVGSKDLSTWMIDNYGSRVSYHVELYWKDAQRTFVCYAYKVVGSIPYLLLSFLSFGQSGDGDSLLQR